jgi:phage terminase small subunit
MKDLTLKEMKFIELYTDLEGNGTFGNGTESYIQAGYKVKNREVARVSATRMLAKPTIRSKMEALMDKSEIDFNLHLRTLDKKLKALADSGIITREELGAIRLVGEVQGKIGNKNQTAIQINVGQDGKSIDSMGLSDLIKLQEAIDKRMDRVTTDLSTQDLADLPRMDVLTDLPPLPTEPSTEQTS